MNGAQIAYKNKVSRHTGAFFEQMITASCDVYKSKGMMIAEKTPEPFRPTSKVTGSRIVGFYEKKAQPDFKGVLKGGKAIVFEAKHTDKDRITYNALTDIQFQCLKDYEAMGAESFILVSFGLEHFYKVPITIWKDMKFLFGRKYLTELDIEKFRIRASGMMLKFI